MGSPSADFGAVKAILRTAKNIVVLSGAGISAESGIPTFRGSAGFWRTYQSQDLATAGAFNRSPSLVWEFYHYRRELVLTKEPNKAHLAIAEAENLLKKEGRYLTVITQNIDGLHQRAGSSDVIELHGSLFKTLCLKCGEIAHNTDSPICAALAGRGAPDPNAKSEEIPESELPRCGKSSCGGLVRPYVIWFGENLHPVTINRAEHALSECDACLVVGTSSVVYPAAMYAPALAKRNIPVAEFNIEATSATYDFMFHFPGPCTQTIPKALSGIAESVSCAPPAVKSEKGEEEIRECSVVEECARREEKRGEDDGGGGRGKDAEGENLTAVQKLKVAVRDYGSTVIVFHVGISLISLGGFYLAVSSGLDMSWLTSKLGMDVGSTAGSVAAGASTFVVAYAVHKMLAPVRISVTLGCTPFIVRYLRQVGILKPPK